MVARGRHNKANTQDAGLPGRRHLRLLCRSQLVLPLQAPRPWQLRRMHRWRRPELRVRCQADRHIAPCRRRSCCRVCACGKLLLLWQL